MMNQLMQLFDKIHTMVLRMGTEEWAVVGICLVLLGFFTMRGYGSDKPY